MHTNASFWDSLVFDGINGVDVEAVTALFGTVEVVACGRVAAVAWGTVDAVRALTGTGEAERSVPGVVIAALSLAVMPFLSAAQRRAGRELGSASAVAGGP